MGKITTEIRYKGETFELRRTLHSNQLRLFISRSEHYAIVVDDEDNVLFELNVYSYDAGQAWIQDATENDD